MQCPKTPTSVVNVNMEMFVGGGAIFMYFTMTKFFSNLINMPIVSITKGQ